MTFFITAYTNDKARLIASESRTDDPKIAKMIEDYLKKQGYIVNTETES